MIPASIFAVAVMAAAPPAADTALPGLAELEEALNDLEKCRGPAGPECPPPERRYKVHGAKCMTIPPLDGRPSVTCRVDETLTYADPRQETTRFRDSCVRFAELESRPRRWTVVQVRDRPCEMASILKGDPNRLPTRRAIESALVGYYSCYDLDGIADCADQPESASLESFRCKPIAPGDKYGARAACRVTGVVKSRNRVRDRVDDACFRLDRITDPERSPAYWSVAYVPDQVRCEIR